MTERQAIEEIAKLLKEEKVIATNGYISRHLFSAKDRPGNFYMLGSMGLAASIAIGMALSCKEDRFIILDGDGSFLMRPENMFFIGAYGLTNIYHIVIDSESYESTGGQRTLSHLLDIPSISGKSGYVKTFLATNPENLKRSFSEMMSFPGPSLLLLKAGNGREGLKERVSIKPEAIKNRFMDFLGKG